MGIHCSESLIPFYFAIALDESVPICSSPMTEDSIKNCDGSEIYPLYIVACHRFIVMGRRPRLWTRNKISVLHSSSSSQSIIIFFLFFFLTKAWSTQSNVTTVQWHHRARGGLHRQCVALVGRNPELRKPVSCAVAHRLTCLFPVQEQELSPFQAISYPGFTLNGDALTFFEGSLQIYLDRPVSASAHKMLQMCRKCRIVGQMVIAEVQGHKVISW